MSMMLSSSGHIGTSALLSNVTTSMMSLQGEAASGHSPVSTVTTPDWQMSEVRTGEACSTSNPKSTDESSGNSWSRSINSSKNGLSIELVDFSKSRILSNGSVVTGKVVFSSSRKPSGNLVSSGPSWSKISVSSRGLFSNSVNKQQIIRKLFGKTSFRL